VEDRGAQFVSRDEFIGALQRVEDSFGAAVKGLGEKIDSLSERRGSAARQVWLGVAGMFLILISFGGAIVTFAIKGAVEPLLQSQSSIIEATTRDHETMEEAIKEAAYLQGQFDLVKPMVLADVRVEHGGGRDAALNQARIEQIDQRLGQLWQLQETLDLKIQRLDRLQAAQPEE
jgi:hypothetical protein